MSTTVVFPLSDARIDRVTQGRFVGSHTYQWVNAAGERFWVKYHFKSQQGIDNLYGDEAAQRAV